MVDQRDENVEIEKIEKLRGYAECLLVELSNERDKVASLIEKVQINQKEYYDSEIQDYLFSEYAKKVGLSKNEVKYSWISRQKKEYYCPECESFYAYLETKAIATKSFHSIPGCPNCNKPLIQFPSCCDFYCDYCGEAKADFEINEEGKCRKCGLDVKYKGYRDKEDLLYLLHNHPYRKFPKDLLFDVRKFYDIAWMTSIYPENSESKIFWDRYSQFGEDIPFVPLKLFKDCESYKQLEQVFRRYLIPKDIWLGGKCRTVTEESVIATESTDSEYLRLYGVPSRLTFGDMPLIKLYGNNIFDAVPFEDPKDGKTYKVHVDRWIDFFFDDVHCHSCHTPVKIFGNEKYGYFNGEAVKDFIINQAFANIKYETFDEEEYLKIYIECLKEKIEKYKNIYLDMKQIIELGERGPIRTLKKEIVNELPF